MAAIVLSQKEQEERYLRKIEKVANQLVEEVTGSESVDPFEVITEEDYDFAVEMRLFCNAEIKKIDARRKTVTDPLNQALKAFREIYRPALDKYQAINDWLKEKCDAYAQKKLREKQEAMKLVAEASREGDFEKALVVSNKVEDVPIKKGISVKTVWEVEEVDLDLVPSQYVVRTLNKDAIKAHIKASKGGKPKSIPGLRFVQVTKSQFTGR